MTARVGIESADDRDRGYVERLRETVMRGQVEAIGVWDPTSQAARFGRDWDRGGARIVTLDGVRVGCVSLSREGRHLLLSLLYVEPPHQGRGIGAAALAASLAEADALGLPVRLTTLRGARSAGLYRRSGFVRFDSDRWEDSWERKVPFRDQR